MEAVTDFIFLGPKITEDSDCSHEHLLLGRKAMTNLDSILKKQRHHFDDKDPSNQRASQVAQLVKNPPAMWETSVPSLG